MKQSDLPATEFPDPNGASPEGLVAVGGDASPARLLRAYEAGIFPWPSEGYPMLWFCPDPRFVLEPDKLHVPRRLRKRARRGGFTIRCDTAFADVIDGCAQSRRQPGEGTWITPALREGFCALFAAGHAHSIECWFDDELVGGLYGLCRGRVFFGESMFSLEPDASKLAFVHFVERCPSLGIELIDCQVPSDHLARFGAVAWSRKRFLTALPGLLEAPTHSRLRPWAIA